MAVLLGLGGEIVYELIKFIIMLVLVVCGVLIGKKLRDITDARKAAKVAAESQGMDIIETEANTKD